MKTIFTGFAPQLSKKDTEQALFFLFPWNWSKILKGPSTKIVEQKLKEIFSVPSAFCFDSGRSALLIALQSLNLAKTDEVLLQAYTCSVVSNAILHGGGKPIYVDVKDDTTMSPSDLESKITSHSKVLVIQHTFGIPAETESLLLIAKKHNLIVIEDSAHAFGSIKNGKMLGTFGDIGMLSFGSDKAISCGRGGALLINNPKYVTNIQTLQQKLPNASFFSVLKQLFTFIAFFVSKPIYHLFFGKFLLFFFKTIGLLSKTIESKEKKGKKVFPYPTLFPNALASIALFQITKYKEFNKKRIVLAGQYALSIPPFFNFSKFTEPIALLRFPFFTEHPKKLITLAKEKGILLGDWYETPIAPKDADNTVFQYQKGSCKNAERLAAQSVNSPIHENIFPADLKRIIDVLSEYAHKNN